MAVEVTLTIDNPNPGHGDVVTATYVVTGNDGTPAHDEVVDGSATVGGVNYPDADSTVTLPASAALPQTFDTPTALGLTFVATADPAVFTAVVP
jgi:hypothetical protein